MRNSTALLFILFHLLACALLPGGMVVCQVLWGGD